MTDHTPWEPNPRTMGDWRSMFEQPRSGGQPPGAPPPIATTTEASCKEPPDDEAVGVDLSVYKPWLLQRGGSRHALMLDFRRYEPRSGLWSGWAAAYPYLVGIEYTGDRMLSLDFGARQFMIEGRALDGLVRDIQRGVVLAVQEYSPKLWGAPPVGPCVLAIKRIGDGPAGRGGS